VPTVVSQGWIGVVSPGGPAPLSGRPPPKSHIYCCWCGPPPLLGTSDHTPSASPAQKVTPAAIRIRTAAYTPTHVPSLPRLVRHSRRGDRPARHAAGRPRRVVEPAGL